MQCFPLASLRGIKTRKGASLKTDGLKQCDDGILTGQRKDKKIRDNYGAIHEDIRKVNVSGLPFFKIYIVDHFASLHTQAHTRGFSQGLVYSRFRFDETPNGDTRKCR